VETRLSTKRLEATYKEYKDKGFVIVGFPANNCLTGTRDQWRNSYFCQMNYGVTFPMMDKVSVKGMTWLFINFWLRSRMDYKIQSRMEFSKVLNQWKGELESNFSAYISYRSWSTRLDKSLIFTANLLILLVNKKEIFSQMKISF
jgi:glutathione peroxidase-family protein